jgi:hypothetical protein
MMRRMIRSAYVPYILGSPRHEGENSWKIWFGTSLLDELADTSQCAMSSQESRPSRDFQIQFSDATRVGGIAMCRIGYNTSLPVLAYVRAGILQ